jgi:TPR repeat protein
MEALEEKEAEKLAHGLVAAAWHKTATSFPPEVLKDQCDKRLAPHTHDTEQKRTPSPKEQTRRPPAFSDTHLVQPILLEKAPIDEAELRAAWDHTRLRWTEQSCDFFSSADRPCDDNYQQWPRPPFENGAFHNLCTHTPSKQKNERKKEEIGKKKSLVELAACVAGFLVCVFHATAWNESSLVSSLFGWCEFQPSFDIFVCMREASFKSIVSQPTAPNTAPTAAGARHAPWKTFAVDDVMLGDEMGRGATCVVHQATLMAGDLEAVAVKVMSLRPGVDVEEEVRKEAAFLSVPGLRGVVQLVGVVLEKGWLVLEKMRWSLKSHMKLEPELLTSSFVLETAVTIIEALKLLTDRKCVHGDMKSDNILIDERGRAHVCDFSHSARSGDTIHLSGGTIPYMAPEVWRNRVMPSKRAWTMEDQEKADVWSFGVVVWEMTTCLESKVYVSAHDGYVKHIVKKDVDVGNELQFCKALLERVGSGGNRLGFAEDEGLKRLKEDVVKWCWSLQSSKRFTWTQLLNASGGWKISSVARKDSSNKLSPNVLVTPNSSPKVEMRRLSGSKSLVSSGDLTKSNETAQQTLGNSSKVTMLPPRRSASEGLKSVKSVDSMSIHELEIEAANRNAKAQIELGLRYLSGKGVAQSNKMAADLMEAAAFNGDAEAQWQLGQWFFEGKVVGVKDETRAVEMFSEAAKQNHIKALTSLGVCYEHGKGVVMNSAKALELLRTAANSGDANAQFEIGVCIAKSAKVGSDFAKAVTWYQFAANRGNANAQFNLGWCYENGKGVPVSQTKAVELYQAAASQGNADAQNRLGFCYANGIGVPVNEAKAVELYALAANQGNAKALYNFGVCNANGTGIGVNQEKAVECYQPAADQGKENAHFWLGVCLTAERVVVDQTNALEFHQLGANQGNARALPTHDSVNSSSRSQVELKMRFWPATKPLSKVRAEGVVNCNFNDRGEQRDWMDHRLSMSELLQEIKMLNQSECEAVVK